MESAWPLWALPFWTMGIPLIWAVIELMRTPKAGRSTARVGAPVLRSGATSPLGLKADSTA